MRNSFWKKPSRLGHTSLLTLGFLLLQPLLSLAGSIQILDGKPKVLFVYHDSVNPSGQLEWRLKRFFNGTSPIVMKTNSPQRYLPLIVDAKTGALSPKGELVGNIAAIKAQKAAQPTVPVIVLQMSNPREFDFLADSTNAAEALRIAKEFKYMADTLRKSGADVVFFSSFHYNYSHRRLAENEPAYIRAFNGLNKDPDIKFIDMVTPTFFVPGRYPLISAGDKRHANDYGLNIYGHEWLKALADYDGKAVPAFSADSVEKSKVYVQEKFLPALKLLSPLKGKFKIGDQVTVKWQGDCSKFFNNTPYISLQLQFRRLDKAPATDRPLHFPAVGQWSLLPGNLTDYRGWGQMTTMPCADPSFGTWTFKVDSSHFFFSHNHSRMNMPMPVTITIGNMHVKTPWMHHWSESNEDWQNPDNMIVLYPNAAMMAANAPVYGFKTGGTVGLAKRAEKARTTGPLAYRFEAPGRVEFPSLEGRAARVSMLDAQGRRMRAQAFGAGERKILSVTDLPAGLYWMEAEADGEVLRMALPRL